MDAVKLPLPVDVASASKLMGSEGFARTGVTVQELEGCDSDGVSVIASRSIEYRSSIDISEKLKDFLYPELRKQDNQLLSNQGELLSEVLQDRSKNGLLLTPKAEGVQSERKAGKVSRSSSNLCSKRPRVIKLQDPPPTGVEGVKDMSHKLTSCSLKGTYSDKTHLVKQKSNLNSKRGDKRSLRVPVKTKYDSFSMKAGSTSFGSASGGNSLFGVYGLKSDNHDVTKFVDDLPLNDLLHGNYQPPSLGKDKGKKATTVNESFLNSLRKSCSLLHLPRLVSQSIVEIDSCSNRKMSAWLLNSVSVEASGVNGEIGDSSLMDVSSSNKDTCIKSEAPDNPPESLLHQPKEILQRLALPPPKDLESLLLDAAKPTLSSKNTADLRPGKQMSRRVSLPPFQWSHTSSGHCRTSSDAVKLSTIKGTCQGRWLKIGKEVKSSIDTVTSNFTDLESLKYDQSLVPSGLKVACVDNVTSLHEPTTSLTGRGCDSEATCLEESRGKVNNPGNAGHCPRLYAAARTLYDIATNPPRQSLDRTIRWPKKSSQKTMKARKLKYNGKTEESQSPLASVFRPENMARIEETVPFPSKKPKLSNINHKQDPSHVRKETLKWSTPRSSRSSPNRTGKDIIAAYPRHTNTNILKQSCMMPPPAPVVRVSDIATNNQQKLRKLPLEWNRGKDRDRDRLE
ncbi:uncharacterized protein LOC115716267 [Cannabis sativa]|uniref:Uncharacterized protein n=1 Tax=Cannabis sativa TaxID=3483 RepID=A0A7J6IBI6_CANSA|nr:uncharacterized protein LOC115716267 [Cannabis sativa]KAF4404431.1 hypothetical protein G4B88_014887 [Cannabis sativa]